MMRSYPLSLVLLATGVWLTFVHDYAYRRVDSGKGDYELNGLISHAGSDMLIVTFALTLVSVAWIANEGRRDR